MLKFIFNILILTLFSAIAHGQSLEVNSDSEKLGTFEIRKKSQLQPVHDEETFVYLNKKLLPNGDIIESIIYRQNGIWNMWKVHFGKYGEDLGIYRLLEISSSKNPPCRGKWELFPKGQSTSNGQGENLAILANNGAHCSQNSDIEVNSVVLNTSGVIIPLIDDEKLAKLDTSNLGLKIWHKEGGCVKAFDGQKWNCL